LALIDTATERSAYNINACFNPEPAEVTAAPPSPWDQASEGIWSALGVVEELKSPYRCRDLTG
jgi:hypothetical protein